MKIMIDINVLLDVAQKREPYYRFSSIVMSEVMKNKVVGAVPSHALTTLYYLVEKSSEREPANEFTDRLLAHFDIVAADRSAFVRARNLPIDDFEDAVVASLAEIAKCNFIVTRNVPDFENSPVIAISPEEFIKNHVTIE